MKFAVGRNRWAKFALGCIAGLMLAACSKTDTASSASESAAPAFQILAGSELRDLEPKFVEAAKSAGINVKLTYAGTLDIVDRVNAGEPFDAILPPSSAYPLLALKTKPLAYEKLFYSRVALGVKTAKAKSLGWATRAPTWAEVAKVAGAGKFAYAMTNPTSSNTGMSALFAVASAAVSKTENLQIADVDASVIKAFLAGQKLTAGSSGWLADAFVKAPDALDGMVNYEAVILRANDKLTDANRLTLVYPQDGVISADYPLMLLKQEQREAFTKLVAALKAPAFQRAAAAEHLRPSVAEVPLAAGLTASSVVELSFPNRLDVVDAVLSAYQGQWRRPSTSIFVLDVSGSMRGPRLDGMREALLALSGANVQTLAGRLSAFQSRERVFLVAFSNTVQSPVRVDFAQSDLGKARAEVSNYANALKADGGTAIYAALIQAEQLAASERQADPDRFISVLLLTDGENNAGPDFSGFRSRIQGQRVAPVFPIIFGEGNASEMAELAQLTGGRVFEGRKEALARVFKEIRGYQ